MGFLSKGGSSVPQAPDPQATAAAQTRSNIETALANARLNRTNQSTPWGSISWEQGEMDANGVPTYSSHIQLSPEQQQLLDAQQGQQITRSRMAADLLRQIQGGAGMRGIDFSALPQLHGFPQLGGTNAQGSQGGPPPSIPGIPGAAAGGMGLPSAPAAAPSVGGASPGALKPATMAADAPAVMGSDANPLASQAAMAAGGANGGMAQILAKLLRGA